MEIIHYFITSPWSNHLDQLDSLISSAPPPPCLSTSTFLAGTHSSMSVLEPHASSEVQIKHQLPHSHNHFPSEKQGCLHWASLGYNCLSPQPSAHTVQLLLPVTWHPCCMGGPRRRACALLATVAPQSPQHFLAHRKCLILFEWMGQPTTYK